MPLASLLSSWTPIPDPIPEQLQRIPLVPSASPPSRNPAMEEVSQDDGGGGGASASTGAPISGDPLQAPSVTTHKGVKSCKGCLYYSSLIKADARNPVCIGISRTLPNVPDYIVGESEVEATKEGRGLLDFKYACVGYSLFLNNKDNPNEKPENRAELPICAGIELLVDRRITSADHVPVHAHNKEEGGTIRPQPRPQKPVHSPGEEFYSRFKRNAGLVASGVVRNVNRVATSVKENLDDMMYPYRRRPK